MGFKGLLVRLTLVFSVSFARFGGDLALINTLLTLAGFILVLFMTFWTTRRTNYIMNKIPSLDDIVRVNEDGSIDMDNRLAAIITGVGQTMMQSFKMSALQGLSVNSKLEKGLKSAFAKDILEEKMPLLDAGAGLLKEFTGYNVKQYIAKNPDALMQLLGMPQVQSLLARFMHNNGQVAQVANRC